jgi:predicted nucleotidyltransferase
MSIGFILVFRNMSERPIQTRRSLAFGKCTASSNFMSENGSLESALAQAVKDLAGQGIPYMLIGGLALSAWDLPRATLDVDLTLWVDAEDFERVCLELSSRYRPRIGDPMGFATKTRVLPVANDAGVRLDFLFAAYPFEKVMVDRAVLRRLGAVEVRAASLEDLILLKIPSDRAKDREDVRVILEAFGDRLDWGYLLPVADLLAESLERPEISSLLRGSVYRVPDR